MIWWFIYEWRKPTRQKTPSADFKVITSEISLFSQQVFISKGIPVPYTNLQWNLYLNTQLDLFCSDKLSFSMHGFQYVTNQFNARILVCNLITHQLKKDVGCIVLQFINKMKITKLLGYKTLRCTNTAASWRERWTRVYVSSSQYACEKPLHQVALTCISCDDF